MLLNSRLKLLASCLLFSAVAACGADSTGSSTGGGGGGGGTPTNVSIVSNAQTMGYHAFTPDTFTVSLAAGGKVKWTNHDLGVAYGDPGVTHHLAADGGAFTTSNIGPGTSYVNTFSAEGTFDYHCTIHPTMRGAIIVTP